MAADPPGQVFHRTFLAELARTGLAERVPWRPGFALDVPALAFGAEGLARPGVQEVPQSGAGAATLACDPVDLFVLPDAVVHGASGVVTVGEAVVAESTSHLPLHRLPGVVWLDETRLELPERPATGALAVGYHLMTGHAGNFFHWMLEALSRFDAAACRGMGAPDTAGAVLLLPPLDASWQRESLALLLPPELPRLELEGALRVERLLYLPDPSGAGWLPHRALLAPFDHMRAAAGAGGQVEGAKLFVARPDSGNRVLENEAELASVAEAAGFRRVVLSGMPMAEQARLFAAATHIIAPHGAGLANLLFCRPGTEVCELQMDLYVNWAFRRLAALRGLRYGCLVGTHIPPRRDWAHHNRWRLEPAALSAVLASY